MMPLYVFDGSSTLRFSWIFSKNKLGLQQTLKGQEEWPQEDVATLAYSS